MDPNLEKIFQANVSRINRGKFTQPLRQAQDYLGYILSHNYKQARLELAEFHTYLINHG